MVSRLKAFFVEDYHIPRGTIKVVCGFTGSEEHALNGSHLFRKQLKTFLPGLGLLGVLGIVGFTGLPPAAAQSAPETLLPWAVHAHRYQDFRKNATVCEVFGEVKNTGKKPVKSFTLHLEMLDNKGRAIASEDIELALRVIVPKNARGVLRAVRTNEIGNFIQDTMNCPENWQEGRIRYKITAILTE